MSDAILIRGVTKSFGPKLAVDSLDLAVRSGGLYGFIGPNGAGKTTTIRMVMAIIFPDRGDISVLGKSSAVESKDRIGYLPEERGVYRKMRVGAFLSYMARLKGIDPHALDRKVKAWLDRVGLADCLRKKCEELSKGMQQKVQYIAAVIHEPDLIILDEPFSGLDPLNRRLLRDLLDEQHRAGRTVIFSTHAMFEAEQICEHVVMIHRGRKVIDSSMRDIMDRFDPRAIIVEPALPDGADLLARVPGVAAVIPSDAGRLSLEARLRDGTDPQAAIRAIAAALPVRRLEVKRVTLEDVFVGLVEASGQPAPSRAEIRAADAPEPELSRA